MGLLGSFGDCKGLVWGLIDCMEHTNWRLSLISLAFQRLALRNEGNVIRTTKTLNSLLCTIAGHCEGP